MSNFYFKKCLSFFLPNIYVLFNFHFISINENNVYPFYF